MKRQPLSSAIAVGAVLVTSIVVVAAPATAAVNGGPPEEPYAVAVWKFNEGRGSTARDVGHGTGPDRDTHHAALHQVGWGDGRIVRHIAGTFDGAGSYAETDLRFDTVRSFTVSAWVRLTDKGSDRTVLSREADGPASFDLRYQQSTGRWVAQMPAVAGDTVVRREAISTAPAHIGLWTHLAATYDAGQRTLRLSVDGVTDASVGDVDAINDPDGPTYIGRSDDTWFAGDIADVKVWDRTVGESEIADETRAWPVAEWEFDDDSEPRVAQDWSFEENPGRLEGGAVYTYPGHSEWDIGVIRFNGTDAAVTSRPVLRTDQSFTVSAWVRPARTDGTYVVLGQDGATNSRFALQWSDECTCWQFAAADTDQTASITTRAVSAPAQPLNTWTHLAAVHDAAAGTLALYVNGEPTGTATSTATPWNATGNFAVGRGLRDGARTGWFPGDIDAVRARQGIVSLDEIREWMTW